MKVFTTNMDGKLAAMRVPKEMELFIKKLAKKQKVTPVIIRRSIIKDFMDKTNKNGGK